MAKLSPELQEALRAKYNPEGSATRDIQLDILKVLKEFDRICTENGIRYWLDGGTCLGTVRHGGFIPWDDDADVCMFQEDYDRFVKVFKEDEHFALTTRENDLYYTNGFAKMRLKGKILSEKGTRADIHYTHRGPWLDIFIIDDVTKMSARIFKQAACHMHIFTKIENPGKVSTTILKALKSLHLSCIRLWTPIMRKLPWARCRYTLGISLYRYIFDKSLFDDLIRVDFEDGQFLIPKNYDKYLTDYFGDYMSLPSEEQRDNSLHF